MLELFMLASHAICALQSHCLHDTPTDSDLRRAMFFDCIAGMWSRECQRRASPAIWSPLYLPTTKTKQVGPDVLPPGVLLEGGLVDDDHPELRKARLFFGNLIDIPWLHASHDNYPFSATLTRYAEVRRADTVLYSGERGAPLCQWISQMTFGLLEAVTHARIAESLLVVPAGRDGRSAVISGTRILRFLIDWYVKMRRNPYQGDQEAYIQHGRDVGILLNQVLDILDAEAIGQARSTGLIRSGCCQGMRQNLVLAVALIVSALCTIAQKLWETVPEVNAAAQFDTYIGSSTKRPFFLVSLNTAHNKMRRAGWCPNAISMEFMHKLRGLGPVVSNLVVLPPYIRSNPEEHQGCNESACVFYTIDDTDEYVPRHVHPYCGCEYIRPPVDDIMKLLSESKVPVVVYDGIELHVQPAEEGPYVAISHVWADGMGSTTEAGLPACVVERISNMSRVLLPGSGAFWLDSLCVPAVNHLRKRAIKLMAQTYRDAAKVLVIDDCIRTLCSENKPWEENLFRIATSAWVRRVWTLQEGLLARTLCFEFVEGPVDIEVRLGVKPSADDAIREAEWMKPWVMWALVHCIPLLAFRVSHKEIGISGNVPLNEVVALLHLRKTSKAEDELIAVSSLLPVNVETLLSIRGTSDVAQQRMKAFLLHLRVVSKDLPIQVSPRLTLPHYTWAPRALSTMENTSSTVTTGTCTEEGFLAEYLVASFNAPIAVLPEWREEGKHYIIITFRNAFYRVQLWVSRAHQPSPSIDAIIFTEDNISTRPYTCAAACGILPGPVMRPTAGSMTSESEPLVLKYNGPCFLQHVVPSAETSTEEFPVLGELKSTQILLT
ncbi:hypothetical protein C8Q78DRAFT_450318 [Trametes maxima]|nr:hypothetical protein C8Q78DRAFT_450318 [Trametes maxima]